MVPILSLNKKNVQSTFSARGDSLLRHNPAPPQCDPRGAFYMIGSKLLAYKKTRLLSLRRRANSRVTTPIYLILTDSDLIECKTTLSRYNRRTCRSLAEPIPAALFGAPLKSHLPPPFPNPSQLPDFSVMCRISVLSSSLRFSLS